MDRRNLADFYKSVYNAYKVHDVIEIFVAFFKKIYLVWIRYLNNFFGWCW